MTFRRKYNSTEDLSFLTRVILDGVCNGAYYFAGDVENPDTLLGQLTTPFLVWSVGLAVHVGSKKQHVTICARPGSRAELFRMCEYLSAERITADIQEVHAAAQQKKEAAEQDAASAAWLSARERDRTAEDVRRSKQKVYVIAERDTGYFKVGVSNNPEARLLSLQTANPRTLSLLCVIEGDERTERGIQQALSAMGVAVGGEWFRLEGNTK